MPGSNYNIGIPNIDTGIDGVIYANSPRPPAFRQGPWPKFVKPPFHQLQLFEFALTHQNYDPLRATTLTPCPSASAFLLDNLNGG